MKGRLERGRQELRTRLLARGLASAVFVGASVGGIVATEALAESFIASTVNAAIGHACGQAAGGGVSAEVLVLTQGELSMMSASFSTKLLVASVSSVALISVCLFLLMLPQVASANKATQPVIVIETTTDPDPAGLSGPFAFGQAPREDKDNNGKSNEAGTFRSRARVGKLIWTQDGKSLIFGGPIDPKAEPGKHAMDMWIFDQSRAVPLPATRERCFTVSRGGSSYVTVDQSVVEPEMQTNLEFRIYDLQPGCKLRQTRTMATGTRLFQTYGLEMSADGKLLATCGFSFPDHNGRGDIYVLDIETNRLRSFAQEAKGAVYCLAFSPDGKKLATGRLIRDKTESGIEVWNVEDGSLLHHWPTNRGMMWNLAFSPDGVRLASVGHSHDRRLGWEKVVSVHNLETGKLEYNLLGHDKSPSTVAFAPDGRLLASGGVDKVVNVWNVSTGKLVKTLTGHSGAVDGIAFSPDGKRIASGDRQKTIRIWDVSEIKYV